MPTRPILRLPNPTNVTLPIGRPAVITIRFPSRGRQQQKFGPSFQRLRSALSKKNGTMQLREDPSALAPERVIVFEIAGTVQNFLAAIARVDGLEFMGEYEDSFASDQDFVFQEKKKNDPVPEDRPPALPERPDLLHAQAPAGRTRDVRLLDAPGGPAGARPVRDRFHAPGVVC